MAIERAVAASRSTALIIATILLASACVPDVPRPAPSNSPSLTSTPLQVVAPTHIAVVDVLQKMSVDRTERVLAVLLRGSLPTGVSGFAAQSLTLDLTAANADGDCRSNEVLTARDPLHPDSVTPALAVTPQGQGRAPAIILREKTEKVLPSGVSGTRRTFTWLNGLGTPGNIDGWITLAFPASWQSFCAVDVSGTVTLESDAAVDSADVKPVRIDSRDDLDGTFDNALASYEIDALLGLDLAILLDFPSDLPSSKVTDTATWQKALQKVADDAQASRSLTLKRFAPSGVCYAPAQQAMDALKNEVYGLAVTSKLLLNDDAKGTRATLGRIGSDKAYANLLQRLTDDSLPSPFEFPNGVPRKVVLGHVGAVADRLIALGFTGIGFKLEDLAKAVRAVGVSCL